MAQNSMSTIITLGIFGAAAYALYEWLELGMRDGRKHVVRRLDLLNFGNSWNDCGGCRTCGNFGGSDCGDNTRGGFGHSSNGYAFFKAASLGECKWLRASLHRKFG